MAESFIECKDIDLLAQAPDFMEDAYGHIRTAETDMTYFLTAITNASPTVKNAYYNTYNSIYTSIDTERNDLYHLQTNTTNIVNAIRAGDQAGAYSIYADQIATAAAELDNEQNLEDTGAEAAEIQEEENFWNSTWLGKALSWVGDRLEELCATIVGALMTLFEALTNLVEDIVDLVVLLGGAIVSLGASLINFIAGKDVFNVQKIEDWTRAFVAHDFSGSIWESFYEDTGFGQWIKKEDWAQQLGIHDTMVSTAEWIGIAVVGAFTGGAGAAALAAAKGFGSTAERAYAQGASFWGGLGVATVVGVVDGFIGYGIGNATSALYTAYGKSIGSGTFMTTFGKSIGMKHTKDGIMFTLVNAGKNGGLLFGKKLFTGTALTILGSELGGSLLLGILDPSKGGMISENGAFNVDWDLYKDGDYQGVHDGYHIKGTDSSDPSGGTAREETSEDESTDEETSEETTFDETSEETTDEPTEEQPEPGTTPVTDGGGGGDNTYPEPEAVTPGNDGGGGGSDVQLEPDPVTEPTPEEVTEPSPEEVTEETTEEPTPEEVTEETTEEPSPEEVTEETSEETTEEDITKYPKVTIERTGPESVTIGDPVNENQGSYNGGGGGGYVNEPSYEDVPISNPVEPTPEITEEPTYNWESATPTVENPDLESVSAEDEVRQVAAREMEVQAVETSGSATLTDVSPIGNMSPAPESTASTYTAPGFDTSMLGMGGVAVTAGGLTTYGITKKSKEEENSRKQEELDEFSRETEEDKDKFDVI